MFYAPSRIRPDFRQAVRKPAREGSREKRAGESSGQGSLHSLPYVPYGNGSFLILTSPQRQPGPAIPAPQRLPASSRSSRGELTGGGVPAPAFRPVPCPRLPPMPGYRGMRVLFRHEAPRGRTHSLPPRICPTCLRKIPGSPGILSCSCRLTFFRRPDENSARQTGGLSAPARDARL